MKHIEWESDKKFFQEQVYVADKYKRSNDSAPDRHWKYATCIFNVIARNKSTLKNIQHMEDLVHRTIVLESGEAVYAA